MEGKSRILVVLAVCIMMLWAIPGWAVVPPPTGTIIRVSTTGNDANDGSTWALAKQTIQAALSAASSGDEVWVAAGSYGGDCTIPTGVKLFGGFAGTEDIRDWTANQTILTWGSFTATNSGGVIDGFKLSSVYGVYCTGDVTFSHNVVTGSSTMDNSAITCIGPVKVVNNLFYGNSARDCPIIDCSSYQGNPVVANNTIVGNINAGVAIGCTGGSPNISNNIVALNAGFGIVAYSGTPVLSHNCVYSNQGGNYSGVTPTSDINVNPLLVDSANNNFRLQSNSPCIDVGDDDAVGEDWVDLDGNFRQVDHVSGGSIVDIGAYEYPDITAPSTPVVTDDGDYTTTTISLHASWTSSDSESGIVEYQYAIGTSPTGYGTGAVTGWTSTATQTGITRIIQRLIGGSPYYFYVKAKNAAGLWSDVGISNGIELQPTTEKLDLLLGLGDFEECHYSRDMNLDEFGVIPTADFTVSDGWTAAYNPNNPYIYKIVDSGSFTDDGYIYMDSGKSYQYIGVNNSSGHSVNTQIYIPVESNTEYPDMSFCPGDTIVFHLDKIISSHFVSGHQGASIGMFYMVVGDSTQYYERQDIDLSGGYANDVELTLDEPNLTSVRPFIQLYIANNNPTSDLTGILLAGAKLYAYRDETDVLDYEGTPLVKNRSIQTITVGWNTSLPERAAARNYDYICPTMAYENPSFSILRELNPDIKIYIGQGGMDACDHSRAARWGVTPFKMDYVVANHPSWLWPQTVPPVANDPGVPNSDPYDYFNNYANAAGISNRYWISAVTNATYQTEWADAVIDLAETTGADGVWIDTCGKLRVAQDGYERDTWVTQQFLHGVIPLLRSAGLTTIVNDAQQNLDGLGGWNGDIAEIYFNPNWEPTEEYTENEGYSENTSENTPDVFFREYSFICYNFGYNSSYWLRCINDAKIVSDWNENLSSSEAKRIQYYVEQYDTTCNPAYDEEGKAGWIPFALASFLLCNNDYISLGISISNVNGDASDAMVDYSITKRLGVPDGDDEPINSDQYFRERYYTAEGSGSYGGVVVVNANTSSNRTYTVPFDAVDDSGALHTQGSNITFLPNMGKILIAVVPR